MLKLFLIIINICFSAIYFSACKKETEILPANYSVNVKNKYFEPLDSIYIGNQYFDTLKVNQTSQTIVLKKQEYQFSCKTLSSLKLSATINIQGVNENLTIIVNNNGKITIE